MKNGLEDGKGQDEARGYHHSSNKIIQGFHKVVENKKGENGVIFNNN